MPHLSTWKVPDCYESYHLLVLPGRTVERSSIQQPGWQVPAERAERRTFLRAVPRRHLPAQAGANRREVMPGLRCWSHFATGCTQLRSLCCRKVSRGNQKRRLGRRQASVAGHVSTSLSARVASGLQNPLRSYRSTPTLAGPDLYRRWLKWLEQTSGVRGGVAALTGFSKDKGGSAIRVFSILGCYTTRRPTVSAASGSVCHA